MIINTGLLPLTSSEVACMKFSDNTFPNYAHFFKNSAIINPWPEIWNQSAITKSYGYKSLIQRDSIIKKDNIVFDMAEDFITANPDNFCEFVITISTHTPFDYVKSSGKLFLPSDMPHNLKNYLKCYHYSDSCIGVFFNKLEKDSILKNTAVVMTGDHTFFKEPLLEEFKSYSKKHDVTIAEAESFCPLLIFSPEIEKHIEIADTCYQMDVFPTILHCINREDYYWQGLGINLFDSVARNNRPISEGKAYEISNKIIRSDYLKKYE